MARDKSDNLFREYHGWKPKPCQFRSLSTEGTSMIVTKERHSFTVSSEYLDGKLGCIVTFGCHNGALCDSERVKRSKEDCIFMQSTEPFTYYPETNTIDCDTVLHSNIDGLPKSVYELFQKVFVDPPEVMMGG